jgi:hypothetical protein
MAVHTLQLSRLQSLCQPCMRCCLPRMARQQAMQQHCHRPHAAARTSFTQRNKQRLHQGPPLLSYAVLQRRLVCLRALMQHLASHACAGPATRCFESL